MIAVDLLKKLAFVCLAFFFLIPAAAAQAPSDAVPAVVEGDLEIVHVEDYQRGKSHFDYYLLPDGEGPSGALQLRFARGAPKSLKPGKKLSVKGKAKGRKFWVDDILEISDDGSDDHGSLQSLDPAVAAAAEPHSTLVLLINITGTTTWSGQSCQPGRERHVLRHLLGRCAL